MKILITGAGGMLGKALSSCLESREHNVKGLPKEQLDVTNYAQVLDTITAEKPELVIHAAAYTKVDQAESEAELAYLINGYGTENMAVACSKKDIPMLYVSTDYVFDGEQNRPYQPWDRTRPLSIYGKSKLAGERAIQHHLSKFYIVRTSWLYGPHGRNFVDTIRQMALDGKPLRVVSDQFGSPTCTLTLSESIADLITTQRWGMYHGTDGGTTNWYEFAKAVVADLKVKVEPIETKDMPRPATRPKYSVLDKTTLVHTIEREMVPWQEALAMYQSMKSDKQPVKS
ncbi:MAG: dTDP-4-dehydrorhamnose reductase [Candidatus Obscuribacterales bacterium]|nr:dTDP-4-dehydrorhamnose reductase [Candidatus Obscuribacterales bacterium]